MACWEILRGVALAGSSHGKVVYEGLSQAQPCSLLPGRHRHGPHQRPNPWGCTIFSRDLPEPRAKANLSPSYAVCGMCSVATMKSWGIQSLLSIFSLPTKEAFSKWYSRISKSTHCQWLVIGEFTVLKVIAESIYPIMLFDFTCHIYFLPQQGLH